MRLFSVDQASLISGWAIFENGNYANSGVIKKDKSTPIIRRVPQMANDICKKIEESNVDAVVIEGIQNQGSMKTTLDLARLQGGIMMWCEVNQKPLYILLPTEWRSALNYQQGPKVKREMLKEQSLNFVKSELGLNIDSEDENEACAINAAAHRIYGWDDDEI